MQRNKIDVILRGQLAEMEKIPHERTLSGYVRIRRGWKFDTFHSVSYDFIDMLSEQPWVVRLYGNTYSILTN